MANEDLKSSIEKLKNARSQVEQERILNDLYKAREKSIGNINTAASRTKSIYSEQLKRSEEELKSLNEKINRYKVLNSLGKTDAKTKEKQRKYVQSHRASEVAEYEDIIKLTKKQQLSDKARLRNQIKYVGQRLEAEKKTIAAEMALEQKRDKKVEEYEKKFGSGGAGRIETKRGHIGKGGGRGVGNIAGDVDDALSSIFKPFKNKSLNPLKWLKGGSDAAEDMEKSSQSMAEWAEALSGTKKAAGLGDEKDVQKGTADIIGNDEKDVQKGTADIIGNAVKDAGKNKSLTKGKTGKEIQKGFADVIGNAEKGAGLGKGKGIVGEVGVGGGVGDAGASFVKASKGLGMMVTVVKALSIALGVLSKMSWIFAIIGMISAVVSAVVSAGIELDKFLKGLNKTFLEMAGPTVGLKDIKKDMGDFNDAIFSLSRNIKLGLKAEDIQGMFKAIAGVGLPAKAFAGLAGGYDNAIKMVRKTNIDLGISFEDAGKVISEQMMDLTTTFDDSRKSLQSLGFEATKAGVTSNKFYSAIQNSVSALSFLGNYTKQASGALNLFMKESTLSFKDAAQAANEYMQAFNKMDWKQLQITFGMAGKGLVEIMQKQAKEMWGDPLKENEKKLADLTDQLEAAEKAGDKDKQGELKNSINNLEKEMKGANVRLTGFNKAVEDYQKSGAVGALQQYRDLLTGNLAQVMGQIEDNTSPGNYTAKLLALQKGLNIGPELVRAVEDAKSTIAGNYNDLSKIFEGKLGDAIGGNEQQIEYTKQLVEYGKANSSSPEKLADLKDAFKKQGESSKMSALESEKYAQDMIDMISSGDLTSKDITDALEALKKGNDTIYKQEATKFLKPDKVKLRQLADGFMKTKKINEDGYDTLNENELDMIKNITSAADYMDMAKDSLKYIAAKDTAGIMSLMLKGVMAIGSDVALLASDKKSKFEAGKEKQKGYKSGGIFGRTTEKKEADKAEAEYELSKIDKKEKLLKGDEKLSQVDIDNKEKFQKKLEKADKDLGKSLKDFSRWWMVFAPHMDVIDAKKASEERIAEKKEELLNKDVEAEKAAIGKKTTVAKELVLPQAPGTPETPPTVKKDFKATQAGLALLDKGDMAFNPAMGIAGKSGAFVNEILSKMGLFDAPMPKGAGGGENANYQINLGGVKVYGDIEDPVVVRQAGEKLTQMVKQVIIKHEREKMLAKV